MPDQSEPTHPDADEVGKTPHSELKPAKPSISKPAASQAPPVDSTNPSKNTAERPAEFGGPKGLEPTRYGDWEKNGRCTDF